MSVPVYADVRLSLGHFLSFSLVGLRPVDSCRKDFSCFSLFFLVLLAGEKSLPVFKLGSLSFSQDREIDKICFPSSRFPFP